MFSLSAMSWYTAAFNAAIKSAFYSLLLDLRRVSTVPLTLRLAFRQREASCERLTDFAGSFRSWMSASDRVASGGIVTADGPWW